MVEKKVTKDTMDTKVRSNYFYIYYLFLSVTII